MRIVSVDNVSIFQVETDEDEQFSYTRYASDNWFVRMGESDEPLYDYEEIEALFQNYRREDG